MHNNRENNKSVFADPELTAEIAQKLFSHKNFAFIVVSNDWRVRRVSENLPEFGFPELHHGVDVTDYLDVLVGLESSDQLDLPVVFSPNDVPVRVLLLPSDESLTIIISDAQDELQGRQLLQQKANENELLLITQNRLIRDIELAHHQLGEKNNLLEEAAKLQNSFLTGVSHEFRTPLSSIIGYTNLLQRELQHQHIDTRVALKHVDAVRRGSKHLLSLVENLLDHGKFDSQEITLRPKPLLLDELFLEVVDVLRPLAKEKDIQLNYSLCAPENSTVILDDSRMRQCLFNLVGNAIKYTDHGEIKLLADYKDETLNIVVQDSGLGISDDDLIRVREPFFQVEATRRSGAGLGLSITERIIDLMGGDLNIRSKIGEGTRVEFSIDAPSCQDLNVELARERSQNYQQMSILVAEDDEDIADLVVCLLEEEGMHVQHAINGEEALKMASKSQFDIVLMDLHMPKLDGYQAAKSLRDSGYQAPIIALTASTFGTDKPGPDRELFDAYLTKPVDVGEILALAESVLGTH